jgi:hypothetical protein
MSEGTVEQILEQIEALPSEDQELLERELGARFEARWRNEAAAARLEAKERGIDQAAIDAAVQRQRCGS